VQRGPEIDFEVRPLACATDRDIGEAALDKPRRGPDCVERGCTRGTYRQRRAVDVVSHSDLRRGHVRPYLDLGLARHGVGAFTLEQGLRTLYRTGAAHRGPHDKCSPECIVRRVTP
jgi:hypothetical protein